MNFMFFAYAGTSFFITKDSNRLQQILGWVLLSWAILMLKDLPLHIGREVSVAVDRTYWIMDSWAIPISLTYLFELTKPNSVSLRRFMLVFTPFLLFTFIFSLYPSNLLFKYYWISLVIYFITNIILVFVRGKRYCKHIQNYYSFKENISLSWLIKPAVIFTIGFILWSLNCSVGNTTVGDIIYFIIVIPFWSYIIYKTRSLIIIENKLDNVANSTIKEEVNANQILNSSHIELLETVMLEKQLYLNPKLTISDVSNTIGTNRTYLSQYINNHLHLTFYDYVNQFRIENASKTLLKRVHPTLTIEEVAEQSGFNSVSTFRRAFIKNTGISPQQFRKEG